MIIGNHRRTWLRTAAIGLAACLMSVATASSVAAQDPAPDPDKVTLNFFKNTEIGGLVDGYYDYFSTKSDGQYRNFDTSHNAFTLNMAELWVAKTPASDSPVGYKIRLNYGPAASNLIAFAEPGGPLVNVEEAYGSYLAGKAQIDFGKFVTNAGAEVIEAKDNWNYSRSLLFALAIPYLPRRRAHDLHGQRQGHLHGRPRQRLEQRRREQLGQDVHGVGHAQARGSSR